MPVHRLLKSSPRHFFVRFAHYLAYSVQLLSVLEPIRVKLGETNPSFGACAEVSVTFAFWSLYI